MKTPILVIVTILSCACAEPMPQPMTADGAIAQPMPDARPAVAISDAAPIDADPGPVETEYPCVDMPRLNYYDNMGRNARRVTVSYAHLGDSMPAGVIIVCDEQGDIALHESIGYFACDESMASCWIAEDVWPNRSCSIAFPYITTDGQYLATCGYVQEVDHDFDGVFEDIQEYRYTVRVIG